MTPIEEIAKTIDELIRQVKEAKIWIKKRRTQSQ
jgi:hypothetical protein